MLFRSVGKRSGEQTTPMSIQASLELEPASRPRGKAFIGVRRRHPIPRTIRKRNRNAHYSMAPRRTDCCNCPSLSLEHSLARNSSTAKRRSIRAGARAHPLPGRAATSTERRGLQTSRNCVRLIVPSPVFAPLRAGSAEVAVQPEHARATAITRTSDLIRFPPKEEVSAAISNGP